jgi:hypothetical protein
MIGGLNSITMPSNNWLYAYKGTVHFGSTLKTAASLSSISPLHRFERSASRSVGLDVALVLSLLSTP